MKRNSPGCNCCAPSCSNASSQSWSSLTMSGLPLITVPASSYFPAISLPDKNGTYLVSGVVPFSFCLTPPSSPSTMYGGNCCVWRWADGGNLSTSLVSHPIPGYPSAVGQRFVYWNFSLRASGSISPGFYSQNYVIYEVVYTYTTDDFIYDSGIQVARYTSSGVGWRDTLHYPSGSSPALYNNVSGLIVNPLQVYTKWFPSGFGSPSNATVALTWA